MSVHVAPAQQPAPAAAPAPDPGGAAPYYTPATIDRWLRDWPLLESLAERPRSSRHYLTWEHRHRRGACQDSPKVEQRGASAYFGDELSYADIKADIERAWIHLRPAEKPAGMAGLDARIRTGGSQRWALHFVVIEYRLQFRQDARGLIRPTSFREIERVMGLRNGAASEAYDEAIEAMAWRLGWDGRDDSEPES